MYQYDYKPCDLWGGAELVTVTLRASRATIYTSDGQKFVSGDGSFQVPKGTTILCSRIGVVTVSPGATKLVDITGLSKPSLWLITEDCTITG